MAPPDKTAMTKYPAAMANAVMHASMVRSIPAMLSPTSRSFSAVVRPMPGIRVMILPMITLSTVGMKPSFKAKKASSVAAKAEINLVKTLFLTALSHKKMIHLTNPPIRKETAASP